MTKLSDIFSRRGEHSERIIPIPALAAKAAADVGAEATLSPGLSALAEEHETLRNLLSDAGRRIDEIGELRSLYERLATPLTDALKSLEQERALALSLAARVEDQGGALEALERDYLAADKRAKLAEAHVERQHVELELARENGRSLASERQRLASDLKGTTVEKVELRRQLDEQTAENCSLLEKQQAFRQQIDAADRRNVALETELASARESLSLLEADRRSVQNALEDTQAENSRLTRRASEAENVISALRGQVGRLELSQAEAEAERTRLAALLEETKEQYQTERQSLISRIEGLQARAGAAEGLLAEARQNLTARAEEARAFDRKAMEAAVGRNAAERRVAQLEAQHEADTRKLRELETASNALKEDNATASKALRSRELALKHAEEKLAEVGERNARLDADLQVGRNGIDARIADLQSALERERGERAAMEGALAGARRENDRLHRRIAALRTKPNTVESEQSDANDVTVVPDVLSIELKRTGG